MCLTLKYPKDELRKWIDDGPGEITVYKVVKPRTKYDGEEEYYPLFVQSSFPYNTIISNFNWFPNHMYSEAGQRYREGYHLFPYEEDAIKLQQEDPLKRKVVKCKVEKNEIIAIGSQIWKKHGWTFVVVADRFRILENQNEC